MVRLFWRVLVFLVSSAVGILVATLLLKDMTLDATGFLVVVVVYSVVQAVILPFVTKQAALHASAFLGGTALLATLIALVVATLINDSLMIDGFATWIAATVIVWLVTALATLLVPLALVKLGVEAIRDKKD
ncbi:hypothetical protein E8D34_17685 [Nocardioides sp. GY 10113]|uniref:hypothetical protein n=1 Tax=Nocardioides sp. GY 10113 TaxID=2569761 RepID=UPI0010A902B7|nr:hypothetical protein [Nocardioides sp. GY 10113]TIC81513.1 hypothetical protein E8D34_17685 [Nocardioides sp. GY 10113]